LTASIVETTTVSCATCKSSKSKYWWSISLEFSCFISSFLRFMFSWWILHVFNYDKRNNPVD
jgi:hypothetical protein